MFTLYWSTLDQPRVLVTGARQRVLSPVLVTQHVYLQVSVLDGTVSLQDSYAETLTLAGLYLETGLARS